jgi:surface protein
MFKGCSSLTELNLSNFNTSHVFAIDEMFNGCSGLTELDLSKFDMSEVCIGLDQMFPGCSSLTTIYSPTNVNSDVELPTTDDDIWYLSDGTVVTTLPRNLSYSVAIGKNDIPTEKKELTSKNTIVKLSATSFTYDGKGKKPTVTVKDSNSKEIDAKYYTVTYTNNQKVGKATVTITFMGKYTGTITKTFKINPKATSLKKVASAKTKTVTVTWKKQATQTTGYEIQYATNSKFTKNKKTVTVEGAKTTSKTIKKLSSKKNYYVRIRTYKTVDGTKYYSAWSDAQSVKTK